MLLLCISNVKSILIVSVWDIVIISGVSRLVDLQGHLTKLLDAGLGKIVLPGHRRI